MNESKELRFKKKFSRISFNTFTLIGLVVALYVATFTTNSDYNWLWLLPLGYFISTIIYHLILRKVNYNFGIVFMIANVIIFIRFVITPFAMVFTSKYNGMGYGPNPTSTTINYAVVLMLLELMFVYFTILSASVYYKRKQSIFLSKNRPINVIKNKGVIIIFILISLLIILNINPSLIIPKNFSSLNSLSSESELNVSGIVNILSSALRTSLLLVSLSIIKSNYNKTTSKIYIFVAWFIVVLYLGAVFSTSRWILLFSSIMCIALMTKLFPKTPKIIYVAFILISLLGIGAISIQKYSWALRYSLNPYQDIVGVLFGQFQEYFSGPRVVAQALDMNQAFSSEIGLYTFLNDFLGSVPGLADFINQGNRVNVYFNRYLNVGNVTHIIPMVGQGYSYIPFFPMLFSSVAQWLMVRFDYKYNISLDLEFKYLYGYIGLYFAMSMGLNTQIIWGNFLTYFIPLWFLFKINRKVSLKTKKQKCYDNEVLENAF